MRLLRCLPASSIAATQEPGENERMSEDGKVPPGNRGTSVRPHAREKYVKRKTGLMDYHFIGIWHQLLSGWRRSL